MHKILVFSITVTILSTSTIASAQRSTLERARSKDALRDRIARAKETVSRRKEGHVIVGQVVVEEGDDPSLVNSQMLILKDGFFAGPTRDLRRPVGFRMHGYAPYDLQLTGKTGDIVDVGVIKMERVPKPDLVPLTGKIILEDPGSPNQASISLSVAGGPVNTPSNGTEPRPRWAKSVNVPITESGMVKQEGFSPIKYYCSITAPGYVSKGFHVEFLPNTGADIGTIKLEKPRQITIEYIVSKESPFNLQSAEKTVLAGGDRWKATPDIYGWDLEFKQRDGEILFHYSYAPCFIADLGNAELDEFLNVAETAAKDRPRNMVVKSDHVYLLVQKHWKRNVLFKVQVEKPESQNVMTWTDSSGAFSTRASFVSKTSTTVTLRKVDGQVVTLPVSKLSAESQALLMTLSQE